jgi:hypothetical protein
MELVYRAVFLNASNASFYEEMMVCLKQYFFALIKTVSQMVRNPATEVLTITHKCGYHAANNRREQNADASPKEVAWW